MTTSCKYDVCVLRAAWVWVWVWVWAVAGGGGNGDGMSDLGQEREDCGSVAIGCGTEEVVQPSTMSCQCLQQPVKGERERTKRCRPKSLVGDCFGRCSAGRRWSEHCHTGGSW
eukprot:COSAG02_NODE_3668_length_6398_cov_3.344975_8_plen_113_part_00